MSEDIKKEECKEPCCCHEEHHPHHHEHEDCCGHEHKHEHHHDDYCCHEEHHPHHHEHEDCCGHEHNHEHHHDDCCCHEEHHHHHHEHDDCCCHEHNHEHHHGGIEGCCCCGHDHGHHDDKEITVKQIIIAVIMFVLGGVLEHLPLATWFPGVNPVVFQGITILCFFVAYIICGKDVIIGAVSNIAKGHFMDEVFLMSIASVGAALLGLFEEATAIMIFYQVGEKFEDYAVEKSRNSIEEISKLRPDHATLKENGVMRDVSPEDVDTNSIIVVKPGDRIPIDGIVTDGESFVDTSALTGESIPRKVNVGDEVLSGSINKLGVLEIRTTKHAEDSALARILELVENATENKTKSEQFVTRFAKVYTPIVVYSALAVAVIPSIFTGIFSGVWSWNGNFSTWVYRALMFLVVSCPCAIVISVPLSFCGGITANTRNGVLIKGSVYLEALAKTKIAVFDKTGTLTKGNFVVTHIHAVDPSITENELLALATHTEMFSTHPISSSLKAAHHDKCCETVKLEDVGEIAGKGIKAKVDGKEVLAGNTKLMEQYNIKFDNCPEHQDGTIIHVACNGRYAGHIVISDEIKEDSRETVKGLKEIGIEKVVMLTGDNKRAASTVAEKLGLHKAYGELLSADKVSKVEELLNSLYKNGKKHGSLIFVGDGINDAPVLARADAGVAMGGMGSDAAVEAADIILMDDKTSKLIDAVKVSRKTVRIVHENIIGSLGIKVSILILSALGLSNMWLAVFGDVGVTILAVLNSLRLLKAKKK